MAVVTYAMVRIINLQFENQNMLMVLFPLGCIGIVSVLTYLGLSKLLRIDEANPILAKLGQIVSGQFLIKGKKWWI